MTSLSARVGRLARRLPPGPECPGCGRPHATPPWEGSIGPWDERGGQAWCLCGCCPQLADLLARYQHAHAGEQRGVCAW